MEIRAAHLKVSLTNDPDSLESTVLASSMLSFVLFFTKAVSLMTDLLEMN